MWTKNKIISILNANRISFIYLSEHGAQQNHENRLHFDKQRYWINEMKQTRTPFICKLCPLASDNLTPTSKNAYLFDLIAKHMGNIWIIRVSVQESGKGVNANLFTLQRSELSCSVYVIIYAVECSSAEYEKFRVDTILTKKNERERESEKWQTPNASTSAWFIQILHATTT